MEFFNRIFNSFSIKKSKVANDVTSDDQVNDIKDVNITNNTHEPDNEFKIEYKTIDTLNKIEPLNDEKVEDENKEDEKVEDDEKEDDEKEDDEKVEDETEENKHTMNDNFIETDSEEDLADLKTEDSN